MISIYQLRMEEMVDNSLLNLLPVHEIRIPSLDPNPILQKLYLKLSDKIQHLFIFWSYFYLIFRNPEESSFFT